MYKKNLFYCFNYLVVFNQVFITSYPCSSKHDIMVCAIFSYKQNNNYNNKKVTGKQRFKRNYNY